MGHARVYSICDALTRYYKLKGTHNVINPIGWDSFGLPAENAAIERGIAPKSWTEQNITHTRSQLNKIGFEFDWNLEVSTCDEEYYKHTQTLFKAMMKDGLVKKEESYVNWDPIDQTVLANEQIDNFGRSWRSGAKAEKRKMS